MNKLYRRNNNGVPTVWWAELDSGTNSITVFYGLVRGNIRKEVYAVTQKDGQKELESRYNDKIKQGYILMNFVICRVYPPWRMEIMILYLIF